jgi:hypothetical protein
MLLSPQIETHKVKNNYSVGSKLLVDKYHFHILGGLNRE